MSDVNRELSTIEKTGGVWRATLKRHLGQDRTDVWASLTNPARFVDWLAPGEIELKEGGDAKLNFVDSGIVIDSKVSAFEEGAVLEYSWSSADEPDRPVRYELADRDDGTALTLTLTMPDDEDIAKSAAGWEAHLMMLMAALEGVPVKFPFERYQSTRGAYSEMVEAL